jgi:hypothetical protein
VRVLSFFLQINKDPTLIFTKIYIKPTEDDPWLSLASYDTLNQKLLPSIEIFKISDILSPPKSVPAPIISPTDKKKRVISTEEQQKDVRRYLSVLNSLRQLLPYFNSNLPNLQQQEREYWTFLRSYIIVTKFASEHAYCSLSF